MGKRGQPVWETIAIFLSILAIWPAILQSRMPNLGIPAWATWALLGAALAAMVFIFVRRIRRLQSLRKD